jgi:DNA topoisomerase-3
MKLIIAEKPSLARDIASALGVNGKRDGYIEGKDYIVTWCIGHLVELANPEVYDEKLKSWSLSTLPFIPETFKYSVNSNTSAQFNVIKKLVNDSRVSSLINCCDAGREGELIFHLVYLMTGSKKPVERLWISSLTKDDILKGFSNLKGANHYSGLRDSAHARQRADWLIGLNITRAFTIKARNNSNFNGKSELYSVGRVQTPTLAFIVGRENEINNFVPEKFYQVQATFDSTVGTYQGLWVGTDGFRIAEEKEAKAIANKVINQQGVIDKVDKKLVKEKSPLLHDLTSLQRVANTKYGLTADQTLKIAQSLYESKLITYPRTSSQYLSTSVANEISEHLGACDNGVYSQFVSQIKSSKTGVKLTSRHVQNDKITDHHAIIPTKLKADLSKLEDEQRKVYDLIVRRFLAAFYPESEIEQTTVFTIVLGEKFVSKGKVILNPGWRVVESPEAMANVSNSPGGSGKSKSKSSNPEQSQQEDEDKDKLLPPLKQHQVVETRQADVLEKWTKPPSRYTEATLLASMETAGKDIADDVLKQVMKDQGLGTPATRASVIETLISREYIFRDKKTLKPTEKGKLLIELLPSTLLKSAKLTAEWEQKLAEMAKGNYSLQAFMDEIKEKTAELVREVTIANIAGVAGANNANAANSTNGVKDKQGEQDKETQQGQDGLICPNCVIEKRNGCLVERTGQYGNFLCCSMGKDICGYISNVPKNQKQRKALVESRCPNCQGSTKLYLPKEKDKSAALFCIKEGCKGVLWFNDKGGLVAPKSNNISTNTNDGNAGNVYEAGSKEQSGEACIKCGSITIKRSFKRKDGKVGYFWGCSNWKKSGGCDAAPVWIN